MAAYTCAITGVTPENPVVSKTGYIFERRIIENYLETHSNTCPVTKEPLTVSDLTPIKTANISKPRPVNATTIPGLLSLMQSEWDSLLLEVFSIRTHCESLQNQLSHALYQHDAACRVIARLLQEKDSLRNRLNQLQEAVTLPPDGSAQIKEISEDNKSECIGIPIDVLEDMKTLAKQLLTQRKKRTFENLASLDKIKNFQQVDSFPIMSTTSPGVTTCKFELTNKRRDKQLFWAGGVDGVVVLFDIEKQQSITRLIGHLKRVNSIIPHYTQDITLTCSDDKTIRVWTSNDSIEYKASYILRKHSKPITDLSLHPSGDYLVSTSKDATWAVHELCSGHTCRIYNDLPCTMHQVTFHPDGLLLAAAGQSRGIHIYDIKIPSQEPIVSLEGHQDFVTSLAFSENGYYLFSTSSDKTMRIWDLRKSACIQDIKTITQDNVPFTPEKVVLDQTGNYAAAFGSYIPEMENVSKYHIALYYFESKTNLEPACHLTGHSEKITDLSFGWNAENLINATAGRTVNLWSSKD